MKITSHKVITSVVQRFLSPSTNHHLTTIITTISNVSVTAYVERCTVQSIQANDALYDVEQQQQRKFDSCSEY